MYTSSPNHASLKMTLCFYLKDCIGVFAEMKRTYIVIMSYYLTPYSNEL